MEMIVDFFDGVITETLGKEVGRRFFPFIMTIFFFMLTANWLDWVPFLDSPTADLNTPLAVGLLVFVVIHFSAIRHRGLGNYLKSYFEPVAILMPLNVVGVARRARMNITAMVIHVIRTVIWLTVKAYLPSTVMTN